MKQVVEDISEEQLREILFAAGKTKTRNVRTPTVSVAWLKKK